MDPAQLTMAAQQADATLAAQTTDQSLQAEIAQSRPDLWASLAANPSVYPDLLAWLFSTGDATVLAILQARGYSPGATATSAASEATAAEPADEVTDEATDEAASAADASDSGTSTDESEPSPEDEGEGEGQDAEESKDSDDADDPSDESEAGEPDDSEKPEESEDPSAEGSEEPAVDTGDTGDTEEPEETEGTGHDGGDAGGAENTEDAEDTEGTGHDAEERPSDSDEAEPSFDESAGVESPDEDEGSDEDSENGPEDAVAVTAAEGAGSDSEPDTETVSEMVSEETISDGDSAEPVGDEVEDEPEGGTEDDAEAGAEPETEVVAEDPSADGAASSGEEAASSGEEPAGQTENIPPVEDTAVFASAGVAQAGASPQSAAPAEGSAAPAVDSAESVAMPVAPPPSAEDIAAWAETPSGAPSGFSAAQPAVELDMFGPQMPPPQQQKQTSDSSRARLVAVIVVLLLVIVGGGGAWAGSYFSGKDKGDDSSRTSQDNAAGDQGAGQDSGQADAAATASALPSGAVQACSSMPTLRVTSVEDGQGELKVQANVTTPCADGDFLAGSANQVLLYSSTSPTGGADVEHLVASATFDLSSEPLIIPNGGRSLTLRFGEQHYFRTAKDLDLKSLKINPTFDRGSRPSVTSGSSANSPMTIASSTSSNVNQEQQDEQAAGEALRWQASHDRSLVMSKYLGKWTPQLSSKKDGLFADGQTWTNRMILAEFLKTRQAHPDAALVYSNDWSVFDSEGGWWVTLSGELYATADEANAWCDAQGYDAEHCLAKRMESSGPAQGTTKSR